MMFPLVFQNKVRNCIIFLLCVFSMIACTVAKSTIPKDSVIESLGSTPSTPIINSTAKLTATMAAPTPIPRLAQTLPAVGSPASVPVLPTPTMSENLATEENSLRGPLVGFRGYDDEGDFLVILDIGSDYYREVRGEIDHPFGRIWHNNGCEIYVSKGTTDLQGVLVWKKPDLDWGILLSHEGAYSEVSLLSPDRQWLAYDILYGEQYYEDSEFSDLGIVNFSTPTNPLFLTSDGQANEFSWSPDSQWLAYKHVDESGVPQLFRTSPDGENQEQLTFHTKRLGIGYIVWSPDGRYIAYAAYQSMDEGVTGTGWVDIVDTHTLSLYRAHPKTDDFGGVRQNEIWWSLDGTQLVFSGRDWQDSTTETQIYWVDVQEKSIVDSYFASAAPGGSINEVYAVGGMDQILFGTYNAFYVLNASDKSYKQIPFDLNSIGQRYDSESAPFNFPGEENCQ
jgi:hypothetical protein